MCLLLFIWHYITDSISANGSNQILMVADGWEWARDVQFWHISTNNCSFIPRLFLPAGLNYTTETFTPELNLCSLDSLGPAPFVSLFHGATLGHQDQEWHKMEEEDPSLGSCIWQKKKKRREHERQCLPINSNLALHWHCLATAPAPSPWTDIQKRWRFFPGHYPLCAFFCLPDITSLTVSANGSNQILMVADAWEWTRDVQFSH